MKITHDFHLHTYLSLCAPDKTGTVKNYVDEAKRQGIKKLGLADHFWGSKPGDPKYYEKVNMNPESYYLIQNFEHISKKRSEMENEKANGVKLYFGCEAEYDPFCHGPAVSLELAEQFDFITVTNSHTHMMMPKSCYFPYQKHIEFMITAYEDIINSNVSRYITSIAHPFEAVACPYGYDLLMNMISDDEFKRLFDKTAQKGIAIEINTANMIKKPDWKLEISQKTRMLRLAKECGCKFIFGSDAHILSEFEAYSDVNRIAEFLDICENDIADIAL